MRSPTPRSRSSRRQQIVEDLLGSQAQPATVALVSMVVGTGRGRDLPAIIDELVRMSAAQAKKEVAEVRSAIDLDDAQRARLAEALEKATGKAVEVKVIVDPTVLGGVVAHDRRHRDRRLGPDQARTAQEHDLNSDDEQPEHEDEEKESDEPHGRAHHQHR